MGSTKVEHGRFYKGTWHFGWAQTSTKVVAKDGHHGHISIKLEVSREGSNKSFHFFLEEPFTFPPLEVNSVRE